MKTFTIAAVAASLLLGVCLFVTGCSQSSTGNDTASTTDHKMADVKMSAMEKMGDGKMADGKMDKMSDGKMGNDKMAGK